MVILGQHVLEWFDFIGKIDSLHKLEPGFSTVSIRSEPQSHSRFRHVPQDRFFALLSDLNLGYKQGLAYCYSSRGIGRQVSSMTRYSVY